MLSSSEVFCFGALPRLGLFATPHRPPSAGAGFFSVTLTFSETMGPYARWIYRWERKLAMRDTNRVVRPFEGGTDWLSEIGFPNCPAEANGSARNCMTEFVAGALADSDRFFQYSPVTDYRLKDGRLTFTSPVRT